MGFGTNRVSLPGRWVNIGSVTTAQAALGVTGRATALADALSSTGIISHTFKAPGPLGILLRIRSDGSENDANVAQIYLSKQNDYYERVVTLTTAQGTVLGLNSTYFADVFGPSNEDTGIFEGVERSIADEMGMYYFRTKGHDKLFLCCSSLVSPTVYFDISLMYE
jgi:hypothetical protein